MLFSFYANKQHITPILKHIILYAEFYLNFMCFTMVLNVASYIILFATLYRHQKFKMMIYHLCHAAES